MDVPTANRPTGGELLGTLRMQPSPRTWLAAQRRWALTRIAVALGLAVSDGRRFYRKDELIDRILLADWHRDRPSATPRTPRQATLW